MSYYDLQCETCHKLFKVSTPDYKYTAVCGPAKMPSAIDTLKQVSELIRWGVDSARKAVDAHADVPQAKAEWETEIQEKKKTAITRLYCTCPNCGAKAVLQSQQYDVDPYGMLILKS